ncbi:hypothetical protein [Aureivirga marina]|uniref:hypothetical protein n=1 Tax=Aureivirga marina TaxID=1182451 RepID=UPI0018CAFC73|nr:hypothetical protein [Aureivirga marina]
MIIKNIDLKFILILLLTTISCENNLSVKEQFFYKRYKNDSLVGYTVRNFITKKDTLKERIFYLDNKYQIIDSSQRKIFLIKKEKLNIIYKRRQINSPYASFKKKGAVTHSTDLLFGKVETIYKGKYNFYEFKDLYKLHINFLEIDGYGPDGNIYLDKNFRLIGKDSISVFMPFDKEIKVDKNEIPNDLLIEFD